MNLFAAIADFMAEADRRRRYRRNELMLSHLPLEIRKDIGWPGNSRGAEDACQPPIRR